MSMWVHWLTDDMSKFYKLAQWRVLNNHLCAWAEVRFDSVLFHHWFWELLFYDLLWLCPSPFDTLIILCMYKATAFHITHMWTNIGWASEVQSGMRSSFIIPTQSHYQQGLWHTLMTMIAGLGNDRHTQSHAHAPWRTASTPEKKK